MGRYHVQAEPTQHTFQWVDGVDSPEEAMAKAMANPNGWTRNNLHGTEWKLIATEHEIPERYADQIFPNWPKLEPLMKDELSDLTKGKDQPNLLQDNPEFGVEIVAPLALVKLAYAAYIESFSQHNILPQPGDWEHINVPARKAWRAAITAVLEHLAEEGSGAR